MNPSIEPFRKELSEKQKLVKLLEGFLANLPEGRLVVMHIKDQPRFYRYGNGQRRYLNHGQNELRQQLATRDYYEQLLQTLKEEIRVLSAFLREYDPEKSVKVYEKLSPERQQLVEPMILSDECFVEQWLANMKEDYALATNSYELPSEFKTAAGEYVRSKSEKIIADALNWRGIPYLYERPLKTTGPVLFPDFTVLNVRTRKTYYLEHLGLTDSAEYLLKAFGKIELYKRAGIWIGNQLILTSESAKSPLSSREIDEVIEHFFI